MRLYEVHPGNNLIEAGSLIPTAETFEDSKAFNAAIESNGSDYVGRRWVLISEDQASRVVEVKSVTSYRAKYPNQEGDK